MFGVSHFPLGWADAILISILVSLIFPRFSLSLACLLGVAGQTALPRSSLQLSVGQRRSQPLGEQIERGRFWIIQNLSLPHLRAHLCASILCGYRYLSMIIDQAGLKKTDEWNSWQMFDFLQFIVDIQTKLLLIIIQFLPSASPGSHHSFSFVEPFLLPFLPQAFFFSRS